MTFQPDGAPTWEPRPTPLAVEEEPDYALLNDRPKRRVLAIVLSLLFAALSLGAWFGIAAWKIEVESLRAEATDLGQQVAVLRADEASLNLEAGLLEDQKTMGTAWAASLAADSEPVIARTAEIAAVAGDLDQCASDWGKLADRYWTSSSSTLAAAKRELSARCDAALADLNRLIPEGWGL